MANKFLKDYFTIESLGDGIVGVGVPNSAVSMKYRVNSGEWVETSEAIKLSVSTNDKVQISCVCSVFNTGYSSPFNISTSFKVCGNIMSLLFGNEFEGKTGLTGYDSAFDSLFYGCTTLTDASNLILPATTLAERCYDEMFSYCTSLTVAPELPATTLASECYTHMFWNCTSLTVAPALPATTLTSECYSGMFYGCTSLTEVPELPATTLADYCYEGMFWNCTSLTEAPALPATTLASGCYASMLSNCTSLTVAPELPATTLADYCYNGMFAGCTSLTTAPELPATTLADSCYRKMFEDCYKLNHITMLATDISATNCLLWWVDFVSSGGVFVKNTSMTSLRMGDSGIPASWTVEDYVSNKFNN